MWWHSANTITTGFSVLNWYAPIMLVYVLRWLLFPPPSKRVRVRAAGCFGQLSEHTLKQPTVDTHPQQIGVCPQLAVCRSNPGGFTHLQQQPLTGTFCSRSGFRQLISGSFPSALIYATALEHPPPLPSWLDFELQMPFARVVLLFHSPKHLP